MRSCTNVIAEKTGLDPRNLHHTLCGDRTRPKERDALIKYRHVKCLTIGPGVNELPYCAIFGDYQSYFEHLIKFFPYPLLVPQAFLRTTAYQFKPKFNLVFNRDLEFDEYEEVDLIVILINPPRRQNIHLEVSGFDPLTTIQILPHLIQYRWTPLQIRKE